MLNIPAFLGPPDPPSELTEEIIDAHRRARELSRQRIEVEVYSAPTLRRYRCLTRLALGYWTEEETLTALRMTSLDALHELAAECHEEPFVAIGTVWMGERPDEPLVLQNTRRALEAHSARYDRLKTLLSWRLCVAAGTRTVEQARAAAGMDGVAWSAFCDAETLLSVNLYGSYNEPGTVNAVDTGGGSCRSK